jgi:GDP-4-dehydro-6-deoxy-D-mannose reductase
MAKFLITGASGFVSRHLFEHLDALEARGGAQVLGVSRSAAAFSTSHLRNLQCAFMELDLLDKERVGRMLEDFRPDFIVHLAAYSSVGYSWRNPVESFTNNTNIFLNLLDQVRALGVRCRILSVGSSEEYGNVDAASLPLREDTPLRPISPYAVARVSQEMLSRVYVQGYGLDIVMTRSFNHTGPFQNEVFVVPSLARQLVAISRGEAPPHLRTGDRTIVRDFVDVRDVVRAYYLLLTKGEPGEVYNVCTGRGASIDEVIAIMQEMLDTDAALETDERLIRPNDNQTIIGSSNKITQATGWTANIPLRKSLADVVQWCARG